MNGLRLSAKRATSAMSFHRLCFFVMSTSVVFWAPPATVATDLAEPDQAVRAGREALRAGWDYDWYDKANDSLARIEVRPPPKPWKGFNWNLDLASLMRSLAWITIAVLVGVIVYLLIRAFLARETMAIRAVSSEEAEQEAQAIARVEALPVNLRNPLADFLAEAERHYREGNLHEAIIYLFSYQLVQLDKFHLLRLAKGKTNRQYLRELRGPQPDQSRLASLLERTTVLFEAAFFGQRPPGRSSFEACWNGVEEFHALLAKQPGGQA